ncbi:hypothetical protein G3479_19285 [Shewanella baltica]|uniref:hypothetical protein n=1 Tax=Shewanella baltica TaxID=62322 RepID=UPI00217D808C|nr:hypothetical protein [Shewanella baltica]MCS6261349.1 hypothetical protein [Shewanella baltica]
MKIRKFAFGDKNTAFIEDRFGDLVNVIFSDDNNKGKTLVLQGIMYALGNDPIFPAGFDYSKNYFFIQFDFNKKSFMILRRNNSFSAIIDGEINILESASEFKYFFDKNIYKLPEIVHRGLPKIIDLSLFLQIFFVGQDKRDTSNIFNSGYYNKSDFVEMLYALNDISGTELSNEQIQHIKEELKQLRVLEKKLSNEIDRFNINKAVLENVKSSASFNAYKEQEVRLKKFNDNLVKLRKRRYAERTRLNNHLNLKAELNSLNRAINMGQVSCENCGSNNIIYKSKDINFDVSNKEVRESILSSVEKNITLKLEVISRIDFEISELQSDLNNEISKVSPELRDIILFKDELENAGSLDKELFAKQRDIEALSQKLKDVTIKQEGLSNRQNLLISNIIKVMNYIYKVIDGRGIQTFTDLFTKKAVNYSGSEEQEFYFAKLYALHVIFKHKFPIIIDSFRDRELSTSKEIKMIEVLESLEKQVIVTATLKKEEYNSEKYETYGSITALDYSSHQNGRILTEHFKSEFISICNKFGVTIL